MPASVQVRVRLDKRALDQELKGSTGSVGRMLGAFGTQVTREVKSVFRDRAGGPWWPVNTESLQGGSRGVHLRITARKSAPHKIKAVNAPMLVFNLSDGSLFLGTEVNHPGSSPPPQLVLEGIERAGRRITFTRAAPAVTTQ